MTSAWRLALKPASRSGPRPPRSTVKTRPLRICAASAPAPAPPSPTSPTSRCEALQGAVGDAGTAAAEAQLVQADAAPRQHREGVRRELGIERPLVACRHDVELLGAVDDQAGEEVEPAGRGLRVGEARDLRSERQALHQRHDVDAADLEQRAAGQVDLVHRELLDALGDRAATAGQEAGAQAMGPGAESQVQAGGLHQLGEIARAADLAVRDQLGDRLARQDAAARGRCRRLPLGLGWSWLRSHCLIPSRPGR